jgi:hypothetical protein
MRKLRALGLGLTLLGASAMGMKAWADGPAKGDSGPALEDEKSPSWIVRFFSDDDQGPAWRRKAKRQKDRLEKEKLENEEAKKAAHKQSNRAKSDSKKSDEAGIQEPSKHDQEVAALKREQAEYLRRLAVCDQLREVALRNNDDSLNHQADELQAQAWTIYSKHVASLSAPVANAPSSEGIKISEITEAKRRGSQALSHDAVSFGFEGESAGTKEEKP